MIVFRYFHKESDNVKVAQGVSGSIVDKGSVLRYLPYLARYMEQGQVGVSGASRSIVYKGSVPSPDIYPIQPGTWSRDRLGFRVYPGLLQTRDLSSDTYSIQPGTWRRDMLGSNLILVKRTIFTNCDCKYFHFTAVPGSKEQKGETTDAVRPTI